MEISFHGKRALVTGAGKGIGREVVKRLVKYGAQVIALSRTESTLKTLKDECPTIETKTADVANWNATKAVLKNIKPVDLLVNNAGTLAFKHFGDYTEEDYNSIMSINVKGVLNISQIVANAMRDQGTGGSIVNVSSIAAVKSMQGSSLYCASKAALDHMTRVMAIELGPHKIRVNLVSPGVVDTDMSKEYRGSPEQEAAIMEKIPLRKFSATSDVVDAIIYLLSDRSAMVHGANLVVDGGNMLS